MCTSQTVGSNWCVPRPPQNKELEEEEEFEEEEEEEEEEPTLEWLA